MADTERHVNRFVFGRLLPVRGVDHVWERRYGWHWVVEKRRSLVFSNRVWWEDAEWLYPRRSDRPTIKVDLAMTRDPSDYWCSGPGTPRNR